MNALAELLQCILGLKTVLGLDATMPMPEAIEQDYPYTDIEQLTADRINGQLNLRK